MQGGQEVETCTAYSKLLGLLTSPDGAGQRHDRKRSRRKDNSAKELPDHHPSGEFLEWQLLHDFINLGAGRVCRVNRSDSKLETGSRTWNLSGDNKIKLLCWCRQWECGGLCQGGG